MTFLTDIVDIVSISRRHHICQALHRLVDLRRDKKNSSETSRSEIKKSSRWKKTTNLRKESGPLRITDFRRCHVVWNGLQPYKLLEYHTDMQRCRFDINLGQCSRPHRADASAMVAQTLVVKDLWQPQGVQQTNIAMPDTTLTLKKWKGTKIFC